MSATATLSPPSPATYSPHRKGIPVRGILIVADDFENTLCVLCKHLGLSVWSANSAEEAIEILRQDAALIGTVLVDMADSDMEVVAKVREVNAHVPCYLLRGGLDNPIPDDVPVKGSSRVVVKPFLLDTLSAILRASAGGKVLR
jgi:CheY-like chemotaxis protein